MTDDLEFDEDSAKTASVVTSYHRRLELAKLFNKVFAGEFGGKVLDDLREFCGVGYDAYQPGSFDRTAYSLGLQRVFLHIEARLVGPGAMPQQVDKESEDE